MSIFEILQEVNENNGANYKMDVLRKYKDSKTLQRVLKMTYDRCTYTYGISMKNVRYTPDMPLLEIGGKTLEQALDILETEFVTRNTTGNAAIELLELTFAQLFRNDAEVLKGIINRDQRINMGRSNINKVFKGLIVKPVYMRCGLLNAKTKKKFNPKGAYVQLKADGTYREFNVDSSVSCISRSGEEYVYPDINRELETKAPGVYFGELTVYRDGVLMDRATGNGILRRDEIPDDCVVVFDCWDFVEHDEYNAAMNKVKGKTPYATRFQKVLDQFPNCDADPMTNCVRSIEYRIVNSFKEAIELTIAWMNNGFEGAILKEADAIFRDGTSPQQVKVKLEIDLEVRCIGFTEGTPGTKREETFGAMMFKTDDDTIVGQTSGFSDDQLADFNGRREELIGKVFTVRCNDITKGRNNDYYALSHPRFIEFRDDRDTTDTFERAMETKQMAMELEQ